MPDQVHERYILEQPPEVNARMTRDRLPAINALLRASLISNLRMGADVALDVTLDLAREIRPHDGAILFVIHPDTREIIAVFVRGFEHAALSKKMYGAGNPMLMWMLDQPKPYLIRSADGDEDITALLAPFGSRSFLSLPCFIDSRLAGALQLFGRRPGAFSPEDIRLFSILSIQAEEIIRAFIVKHDREANNGTRDLDRFDRRYLLGEFRRELGRARRNRTSVSLILISLGCADTDRSRNGYLAREKIVRDLQDRLASMLRPADLVRRYDRQELVAMLPETGEPVVGRVARRLERRLRADLLLDKDSSVSDLTISAAAFPPDTPAELETLERLRRPSPGASGPGESGGKPIRTPVGGDPPVVGNVHQQPANHHISPEIEKLELATNTAFSVDKLFDLLLVIGMQCLQADRGSLLLMNRRGRKSHHLQLQAFRGLELSVPPGELEIDPSHGMLGRILEEKKPLVTADIRKDFPRLAGGNGRRYTTGSCLCVPVVSRGQVMGVFCFTNRPAGVPPFASTDLDRVEPVIGLLATLISEGRRFKNLQFDFLDLSTLALVQMSEAQMPWRKGHAQRVATYSLEIAKRLGLTGKSAARIEHSALLHDIGLIGVCPDMLSQKAIFSDREREIAQGHTTLGWKILKTLPHSATAQEVVLHHHERMDGSGYPDGLNGSQIPLSARIVAAADVFDALTSDRPHRAALSPAVAVSQITGMSVDLLDAEVAAVLPEIVRYDH